MTAAVTAVTTQEELDAAIQAGMSRIVTRSPRGVWLTVRASESSTVEAHGSSTVKAYGSSTVEAYGSSTVRAYGSSTVEASRYVAVHLFEGTAHVEGGVVIDVRGRNDSGAAWCDYHGAEVSDAGSAVLCKAVRDDWCTGRGPQWTYQPGSTVVAEDFAPTRACGNGLHLCPTPRGSRRYLTDATRFVAVEVAVDDIVPLDDKCKVPSCRVLYEVDVDGQPVEQQ